MIAHRQEPLVRFMDDLFKILPLDISFKIDFCRTGKSSVRCLRQTFDDLIFALHFFSLFQIDGTILQHCPVIFICCVQLHIRFFRLF